MSCTACEMDCRMVQAGKLGEEIVVRCPHCGAIVILDSEPGAPQSFPVNKINVPKTVYVCPDYRSLVPAAGVGTFMN
jgi:hypothetical protein